MYSIPHSVIYGAGKDASDNCFISFNNTGVMLSVYKKCKLICVRTCFMLIHLIL